MKDLVKPEMFNNMTVSGLLLTDFEQERLSALCNTLLSDFLEKNQMDVYGYESEIFGWRFFQCEGGEEITHTALLIDIKELEKKKCAGHLIESYLIEQEWGTKFKCANCGVKLKQVFEEVKE